MASSAGISLRGPYVWGAPLELEASPPDHLEARFSVPYSYVVRFTRDALDPANEMLAVLFAASEPARVLAVLDGGLADARPELKGLLERYATAHAERLNLVREPLVLSGGEQLKERPEHVNTILEAIYASHLDRHSYVLAVGGGALLDVAGYAAAVAHRGLRLVRMPTTVLAQADSGVGVKNGINAFATKNFIGTFAPPIAVINDDSFLLTLPDREWRAGLSEAVKVALLGDAELFADLERLAPALIARDRDAMAIVIRRCAQLHVSHIVRSGDPFESRSARPLDFGHWAAHKLERITDPRLRHGEAVAVGIALDCTYAQLAGMLPEQDYHRVIALLEELRLPTSVAALEDPHLLEGLREFREHLGGELTIALIDRIGSGLVVHEMDPGLIKRAISSLRAGVAASS
jgi:3-dehydroquinate synthase